VISLLTNVDLFAQLMEDVRRESMGWGDGVHVVSEGRIALPRRAHCQAVLRNRRVQGQNRTKGCVPLGRCAPVPFCLMRAGHCSGGEF
jgi:hypothetical protein